MSTLDIPQPRRRRSSIYDRRMDNCLLKDPNLKEDQVKKYTTDTPPSYGPILQSFSVLDENGDGKISKREIARAYRLAGFNPTNAELDEIVREHDKNDDGYIDFEEYFNVMRTRMIKLDFEKERMKTAFKVLDTDSDGYITVKELEHALTLSGGSMSDQEIRDLLAAADTNGDGKIDYNEFVDAQLCKKVF